MSPSPTTPSHQEWRPDDHRKQQGIYEEGAPKEFPPQNVHYPSFPHLVVSGPSFAVVLWSPNTGGCCNHGDALMTAAEGAAAAETAATVRSSAPSLPPDHLFCSARAVSAAALVFTTKWSHERIVIKKTKSFLPPFFPFLISFCFFFLFFLFAIKRPNGCRLQLSEKILFHDDPAVGVSVLFVRMAVR